ncbi:MAG: glycosyltransferase [Maribacter sp.]
MQKICFFNTAKAWGGGEKWHLEISSYLHEKGYPVFVIAHEDSELFKRLKIKEIPCKGISINNLSFLNPIKCIAIKNLFIFLEITAIVMNLSRDLKIAGPAAKKAGIKRIIYRRGSAIPIKNTVLNRYYFKTILTDVLANSEATKKTVTVNNEFLFNKERIKIIYNGIEIEEVKTSYKNEIFTLLNLGRLEYQKNQEFLILLALELKKREISFKILIGGEGGLKRKLQDLIENLNLTKQVELVGFIENPTAFINQCDVFALPSLWEGFGYVLAEAALCKKPIVAFNISSNPELVIDGDSGYLTPSGDLEKFADKVVLLYKSEKERKRMGQIGFEHIKRNFNKKIQLKKIEDYLING